MNRVLLFGSLLLLIASPQVTVGAGFSLNRFGGLPVIDLYRPRLYKISRFQSALRGAGAGMNLGFVLGGLAHELGATGNEDFRWYLGAAAAATGAILGGTIGAEDSRWSVGVGRFGDTIPISRHFPVHFGESDRK